MGSSIVGSMGGWFWQYGGWNAVSGLIASLAVLGVVLAKGLQRNT